MKKVYLTLSIIFVLTSCSSITMLRTKELNRVRDELDSANTVRLSHINKRLDSMQIQIDTLVKSFNKFNDDAKILLRNDRMSIRNSLEDLQKKLAYFQSALEESQHQLKSINSSVNVLSEKPLVSATQKNDTTNLVNDIKSKELYDLAYKDYLSRKYDLAIGEFKELLTKYSGKTTTTIYIEMSNYFLGQIYQTKNNLVEAEKYYKNLIEKFKDSPYAKSAYLRMSEIYIKLGDAENAKKVLNELIKLSPESPEGLKAKERLSKFK